MILCLALHFLLYIQCILLCSTLLLRSNNKALKLLIFCGRQDTALRYFRNAGTQKFWRNSAALWVEGRLCWRRLPIRPACTSLGIAHLSYRQIHRQTDRQTHWHCINYIMDTSRPRDCFYFNFRWNNLGRFNSVYLPGIFGRVGLVFLRW